MSTFLFDSIVFGPVRSRRLGASLGMNLLPPDRKVCSFNCVYCECGWTDSIDSDKLPSRGQVQAALEYKLKKMISGGEGLDVITFAGNGEPTLHPDFSGIIDDTIELRNTYFPNADIAVLSNATMLHRPDVVAALKRVDKNILKLDSAFEATINALNQPLIRFDLKNLVDRLMAFEGKLIIQSLFVRGSINGIPVDNTTPAEISAWLKLVDQIRPSEVMIYTIARDTPANDLKKLSEEELNGIAQKVEMLGIATQVSA
ncbi:MAG TPA: radical SAM protein [Tenuifilaceae bacterium]|jgi:wyosine [tRNA(Phe)-imidazoG37] synthetase (radical SAM superfamily)|nr:radical SAM protein [Tenuifilaceae bacterium]HOC37129.1 radical SAM protein [Tenuifilaceae bacterium]HOG72832.1 radical SAM protein [Tenuifilaceae bacterium]HPA68079.1 radical SAM protein [Tenuifilaceae bacterium]HQM05900.1 radical SAM protein [Tenuifilaceae bacterium]